MLVAVSLEKLLERQAGVVTLTQAVACGLSADTVRRRARDGRWTRLHPSVYLVGGHRLTGEAPLWAAWLHAGRRRHGVRTRRRVPGTGCCPRRRRCVDVTLPAALHRRPRPGLRWHRHDLLPVDRVAPAGSGADCAPVDRPSETALALPDGCDVPRPGAARHVRFPTLYRAYCRHLGRRGWARSQDADLRLGRPGRLGRLRTVCCVRILARRRRDRLGVGPSLRPRGG